MKHLVALAVLILLAASLTTGCGEPGDSLEAAGSLQFSADETRDSAEAIELLVGQTHLGLVEGREAMLVFLRGISTNQRDKPYAVEFVRTLDAEMYSDINVPSANSHLIMRAEIVDEDGTVLWTENVNSIFQSLEFLKLILEQTGSIRFTIHQIYNLVKADYPELLEFAVRIPMAIEGGVHYVLHIPTDAGNLVEIGRFDIATMKAAAKPVRFEGTVTALVDNGPSVDKIDVVILSDGYTEAQREKFELDAQATAKRLLETTPLYEHRDLFNIWAIWTPSKDTGASYDCRPGQTGCEQRFRDTAYETVFVIPAVGDKFNIDVSSISDRVAFPVQIGKAFETAALVPYDEVIVLSNSQKRAGFAGLYVALVTSWDRGEFPDVAVHEFGHTFGILGDEYQAEGDACYFAEPKIPLPSNIATAPTATSAIKWAAWLVTDTPIPTPTNLRSQYRIGAYKGAYNCDFLYRPAYDCKMNSSHQEFCAVCAEQMVRRIYSVVDVTRHEEAASVERLGADRLRFRVPLREQTRRYSINWMIGDEVISNNPTLDLSTRPILAHGKAGDWVELVGLVEETTGFVRVEDPRTRERFSWWVRVAP
ncbi:MAG: hypothetical protein H0U74_19810 [Bradymonadaceae bacterium]|nr:hypothetical protein [Lujinxingiaceae bacterium]